MAVAGRRAFDDHASLLSLSLQDLRLLGLLLQEGSVTRAAERSDQTQPAVSRKLQRLRQVLGDPILVRSGVGLAPTERAAALREPLREIEAQVARLQAGTEFDPATSERTFVLASADSLAPDFLPDVVARVVAAGPRLACHVRPVDAGFDELSQALDAGTVDLVISNEPRPREDLRTGTLYRDDVVCMLRADHPAVSDRRLTLARYLRLRHVVPHAAAQPRTGPIDGALANAGYQRRISATLPEFNQVPLLLMRSDLVFTTARRFAEHHAATRPIVLMRAPAELPPMRFYQLWHERVHASASNRWLREQVSEVARRIAGSP